VSSEKFPVLQLSGTPRNRGRAHGEALRKPIAELRERWRASLVARFGAHPDNFIATFLAETRFADAIQRRSPPLLEEIEGIAEGSGRSRDETLAFQFMDEEWWFGAARFGTAGQKVNRCSVIASRAAAGRPPILAQNMDLPAFLDGAQTVLRIRDDHEPDATVLTICGMIGLCGANDLGVGVAVNTLWQLPTATDGLPVACVMRSLLAKRNRKEAANWLCETPHASGQHYMLGDPDGFASFEASGKSVTRLNWDESAPSFIHTNHPLADTQEKVRPLPAEENSRGRYQALRELTAGKSLSVLQVQSALSDCGGPHPISARPKAGVIASTMTFASIVMELKRPPAILIAAGPPCSNFYAAIAS
jgi:isopenicillin-N N-acyltransferase like protein